MRINARDLPKTSAALMMLAAPLVLLVSSLVSPALKTDSGAQLNVISQDPGRWYASTVLLLVGSILLVPALIGVAALARTSSPRLGNFGGALVGIGALVAIGDVMTQLVTWQMVAPGANHAQMAALLDRFQNASGASAVFGVGGLALVAGSVVLAVALVRRRVAPAWAAIGLPVGMVANLVAFASASSAAVAVSWAILLVALGGIGRGLIAGKPARAATVGGAEVPVRL